MDEVSAGAVVRPPQREISDHFVQGTFPTHCMILPLLPKLSNWPISRHYRRAQGDQTLLEACRREDWGRDHSALYPFQWNTWQQDIHPRTYCLCSIDIPSSWSFLSTHRFRNRFHIVPQSLDSLLDPVLLFVFRCGGHNGWRLSRTRDSCPANSAYQPPPMP